MLIQEVKQKLEKDLDTTLQHIYVASARDVEKQKRRYTKAIGEFEKLYNDQDICIFSTSGRTEVGGNHTDHQRGKVLAASVNMDTIAIVSKNDSIIKIKSDDYCINDIDVSDIEVKKDEQFTSMALIRGTVARFQQLGYKTGGFNAYITSDVLKGSGISSSAAFEVLIGTILNHLYNDGSISPIEIAQIAQYSENIYFNKPCGLMDQMACSVGGFVTIDFYDTGYPIVEKVEFDFASSGYRLCLVDTGGNHADLSNEYGAMVNEMKAIAAYFQKEVLSEVDEYKFYASIAELRELHNDRAILRAIHYFEDNKRVVEEVEALKANDIETFKQLVIESGHSSYMYLQNVFCVLTPYEQGLSLALAISEMMLKGKGAYRVHGGGLAGTIQAFVKEEDVEEYQRRIEDVFGKGSCHILSIRPVGSIQVIA